MSSDVNVLIVDDSAVVRQVLSGVVESAPGLHVMGAAPDPIFALERMKRQWPDVILLDVEMPRMDGITFLRRIMAVRPTPVIICSTLTERGASITMEAVEAGAVDIVAKPAAGLRQFLETEGPEIVRIVEAAAAGNMTRHKANSVVAAHRRHRPVTPVRPTGTMRTTDRVVAIGTSTGGTQAIEAVLRALPRIGSGIAIVQHMPEKFTAAFAQRLDRICDADVSEAVDGDRLLPGRVLIAPGGRHMSVVRDGAQYRVQVRDGERVNRHRPSVDVLFRSVAEAVGRNALGVIMTGMGGDGSQGLLEMRKAGARTIGQDEETCVVYGMPKVAHDLGATEQELPLEAIAEAITTFAEA